MDGQGSKAGPKRSVTVIFALLLLGRARYEGDFYREGDDQASGCGWPMGVVPDGSDMGLATGHWQLFAYLGIDFVRTPRV